MLQGTFKGEPVTEAKGKVQKEMIDAGLAFKYAEPEGKIISRSGDDCIVALCDQWYLDYGEASWKVQAEKLLAQLNTFQVETRNSFEGVLSWLHQWACARSHDYGRKSSNLNPHALSELDIIVVLVGKSWPKCIVEAITSNNK
jgi:leucyl-tRNA synthetase